MATYHPVGIHGRVNRERMNCHREISVFPRFFLQMDFRKLTKEERVKVQIRIPTATNLQDRVQHALLAAFSTVLLKGVSGNLEDSSDSERIPQRRRTVAHCENKTHPGFFLKLARSGMPSALPSNLECLSATVPLQSMRESQLNCIVLR